MDILFGGAGATVKVGVTPGTAIEGILGAQLSLNREARPFYSFGDYKPQVIIQIPVLSSGSFNFVCADENLVDVKGLFVANCIVSVSGLVISGVVTGNTPIKTFTCSGATFQSQSFSMNAQNEGTMSVSFAFKTWAVS